MRYRGTLIAVTDLERSIRFYREVLGLGVEADFGASVMLEGGIFLQTLDTWKKFIGEKRVEFQHNSSELYFEQRDMENYLRHLETQEVSLVHPPMVHSWGQKAVRLYDPDGHIIEVAEELEAVVSRHLDGGLTVEETAVRMDVPLTYVENLIKR